MASRGFVGSCKMKVMRTASIFQMMIFIILPFTATTTMGFQFNSNMKTNTIQSLRLSRSNIRWSLSSLRTIRSTVKHSSLFAMPPQLPLHDISDVVPSSFVHSIPIDHYSSISSLLTASSSLFDDIQSMSGGGSSTGGNSVSSNTNDEVVWIVRILSGILTYFGLIYYLDRPRGELYVPLVDSNGVSGSGSGSNGDISLQVRPSNVEGAGLGLFVASNSDIIRKGTILGSYPGIVVELQPHTTKLRSFPQCEAYIWRFSDNKYVIDPTNSNGILDNTCVGGNPSSFLSEWFFQTIASGGGVSTALCRINEPPRGFDVNVITTENIQDRTVTFEVERDVYPNEELFIDYGLSYDRTMYQ